MGLKSTKSREAVLMTVYNAKKPITAEQIFEILKSENNKVDLATIYRTLETFKSRRVIKKIDLKKDSFYYEMNDTHHHHILCNNCGEIEEIELCGVDQILPHSEKFAVISDHSMEFFGICNLCVKNRT